jgi:DNA polymerase-3 subunit gamma/tau
MPDAPEEPGFAEVPGRLTAASIREVWPEIMTAVSRKSKKIAALAQGATVRDLEGETVVLTFRFPAHAKMVAAEPALISDALYEALGGRWQIRCDVAGESGPSPGSGGSAPRGPRGGPSGPAQRSPQVQDSPPQSVSGASRPDAGRIAAGAGGAPSRQREAVPRASVAVDGDDWPEPARPGGLATAVATQVTEVDAEDNEWPEPARPGGAMPGGASAGGRAGEAAGQGFADPSVGQTSPAGDDFSGPGGGRGFGGGTAADPVGMAGRGGASGASTPPSPAATVGETANSGGSSGDSAHRPGSRNGSPAAASTPPGGGGRSAPGGGGRSAPGGGGRAASSGLAAARAAAAGAGRSTNAAPPTQPGAWSDGSPTEEAPYDPEYDGPPRPNSAGYPGGGHQGGGHANGGGHPGGGHPARGGSTFEGFDPGDEPLDDVIDEKTARQSSEQQAVQLLRDALGAEKISES